MCLPNARGIDILCKFFIEIKDCYSTHLCSSLNIFVNNVKISLRLQKMIPDCIRICFTKKKTTQKHGGQLINRYVLYYFYELISAINENDKILIEVGTLSVNTYPSSIDLFKVTTLSYESVDLFSQYRCLF